MLISGQGETETQIEKGLYEDLSQANTITLSELMQTLL
jgi:hypothetical protein